MRRPSRGARTRAAAALALAAVAAVAGGGVVRGTEATAASAQHGPRAILSVVIDDMGWHDAQPHNPTSPTPTLGSLAAEGVLLERHYTYTYCSPTRRSFLTGRFPVHIGGTQADICSNWTPLGMTVLSEKLNEAGFVSHFVGKTNIGFQTTDHMPVRRGFATHVGYLYGAESYSLGQTPLWAGGGMGSHHAVSPAAATASGTTANASGGGDVGDSSSSTEARIPGSSSGGGGRRRGGSGSNSVSGGQSDRGCVPYTPECIPESDLEAHTSASWFDIDFWEGEGPAAELAQSVYYSTNFYTDRALAILRNYTAATHRVANSSTSALPRSAGGVADRLYLHLCYQAVHSPFTDTPPWERSGAPFWDATYGDMLFVMDRGLHNITTELKSSGLWNETLVIVFSDNGGPSSSTGPNNYPLRGSKESPWEGGTRVFTMVTGGFVPGSVRGTTSQSFVHVADWYATLSRLVGVDPTDVFDGHDVDSIDVWPMITGANLTNPREYLPVTEQTIIWQGRYKYFSSTDTAFGFNGWSFPNATKVNGSVPGCTRCLFDIIDDPEERHEITLAHPEIAARLGARLATYRYYTNASMSPQQLEQYDCAPLKPHSPSWPEGWPWVWSPGVAPNASGGGTQGNATFFASGAHVSRSADGKQAAWAPGAASCNQVALVVPSSAGGGGDSSSSSNGGEAAAAAAGGGEGFWVAIGAGAPQWIDVGWCSPRIPLNLSGPQPSSWMGDQVDRASGAPLAWVYRASGLFRTAALPHAPGTPYGARFGGGSNVTAVKHSPTSLEFYVDGRSQGVVSLPAAEALPDDAVGCVGVCTEGGRAAALVSLRPLPARMAAVAGPCCRRKDSR